MKKAALQIKRRDKMLFCQQFNNSNDIDSIFRKSCESYYESVLKYCICMIGHNEDAKDCTQEAFTGYYKALLSGKKIKKHHAYILKIAKNICNQRLRMMEKHDKEIASFLEHYQLYGQLSLEEQFDNDAIDGKVEQIAQSIIESLSATEKDLYYNYFINRLTAKQIANIKHESPSSIGKKIKKLKKKITKLVKKAVDTEGGVHR